MNTEYLVTAANEMFRLIVLNGEPSPEDILKAAHIGCETLNILLNDEDFFREAEELGRRKVGRQEREEFDYLTGDLAYFINHFLKIERDILLAGGIDEELVNQLLENAKDSLQAIRNWDGDAEMLRWLITRLREEICHAEEALDEEQSRNEWRDRWRRRLKRATLAIGGAAIVGLDASALAATYGLSAPGTAVSAALGGALIGVAVPAAEVATAGA